MKTVKIFKLAKLLKLVRITKTVKIFKRYEEDITNVLVFLGAPNALFEPSFLSQRSFYPGRHGTDMSKY
eukprot:COSAG06_NODE_4799_length_3945_cov_8.420376_10_plen_69_part_00